MRLSANAFLLGTFEVPNVAIPALESYLREKSNVQRINDKLIKLLWLFIEVKIVDLMDKKTTDVFVPCNVSKQFSKRLYTQIRDSACYVSSSWSIEDKRCKRITAWKEEFNDLFTLILQTLFKSKSSFKINVNPGAEESNYFKTEGSARLYHFMQNMPREMKKKVFGPEYTDLDVVSCFPNIFNKEIVRDREKNPDFELMISNPKAFLQKIEETNAWDSQMKNGIEIKNAKVMRSKLFSGRRLNKIGVAWYDALAKWIQDILEEEGLKNTAAVHMFFTTIERAIIEKAEEIIGKDNVVLYMHDGLIVKNCEGLKEIVEQIVESTGFEWKWEVM